METKTRLTELQGAFVAPRGVSLSRPRAIRLTAAGRALMAMAVLMFAGAILALVGLSRIAGGQAETRRALAERGATTTGEVTRLWASGDNARRVSYRFQVDGRTYNDSAKVSREARRALVVGAPVGVRYLPANPEVSHVAGAPPGAMPPAIPYVAAVAIAAAGVLCLLAINAQRRLLAEGRAAPAIVTGDTRQRTSHGGQRRSLTYEFLLLTGVVMRATCVTSSKPPQVGSVVCVIYDPEQPSRSAIYPLQLVAPAG
jgi:hypothetical protein